jgi:hypothetical protein
MPIYIRNFYLGNDSAALLNSMVGVQWHELVCFDLSLGYA